MDGFNLYNLMNMKETPERCFLVAQGANLLVSETEGVIRLNKSGHKFEQWFDYDELNTTNFYDQLRCACAIIYWELLNDGLFD